MEWEPLALGSLTCSLPAQPCPGLLRVWQLQIKAGLWQNYTVHTAWGATLVRDGAPSLHCSLLKTLEPTLQGPFLGAGAGGQRKP